MDQKWPSSDFQLKNFMSNTDSIHLKIIFYIEYWIRRKIFIMNYENFICWHHIFRQKRAFFRLSTSMLDKCGYTRDDTYICKNETKRKSIHTIGTYYGQIFFFKCVTNSMENSCIYWRFFYESVASPLLVMNVSFMQFSFQPK